MSSGRESWVGEATVSRSSRDTRRTTVRRRAVGTRDRIIAHLALVAEVIDGAGMASTRLAEAVGYPGSSVAFAQLLSGMERDGLISREVRGKRTYRITLSTPVPARTVADAGPKGEGTALPAVPVAFPAVIDYDELADRVILRLLRRLAELGPADLATLERLLAPRNAPAEELKIVLARRPPVTGGPHAARKLTAKITGYAVIFAAAPPGGRPGERSSRSGAAPRGGASPSRCRSGRRPRSTSAPRRSA